MTINEIKNENGMLHLEVILCIREFEKYILLLADKINIDLEAYRKYFDTLIKTYNIKKSQNIATT